MRPLPFLRILPAALLLLALLLPACAGGSPTATLAPVFPTDAEDGTPQPSLPPEPTATLYPSQTPLPTRTPTAAPTATQTQVPSPTPDPALAEVKLAGLSWLAKYKYNLMVSLDFPGPVRPEDYRVTLEDRDYLCEVLPQHPNRLYCNGQGAKVLDLATVRVYPAGSSQPGFEKKVLVPFFDNNYQIED